MVKAFKKFAVLACSDTLPTVYTDSDSV